AKLENHRLRGCFDRGPARSRRHRERSPSRRLVRFAGFGRRTLSMALSEFRGNPQIVAALRGALRTGRVPHALLFSGPHGVAKFTLARLCAQAANCERLTDDACGECHPCQRIALLAEPQRLVEQGLVERGESADAATVERIPLILQSHPDVW